MANQIEVTEDTFLEIIQFVKEKNFNIIENHQSKFFGDRYSIFTNGIIYIRLSIDKGVLGIEFASNQDNSIYYDLDLLTRLLHNLKEKKVNFVSIDIIDFFKNNFETLLDLFYVNQLDKTITELKKLTDIRVFEQFGNEIFE